jgi:hypothetical protein
LKRNMRHSLEPQAREEAGLSFAERKQNSLAAD